MQSWVGNKEPTLSQTVYVISSTDPSAADSSIKLVLSSGEREVINISTSVCWFQLILLKTYAPGELKQNVSPLPPPTSQPENSQVPPDDGDGDGDSDDEMPTEPAEEVEPSQELAAIPETPAS
jgi:hypothetical protein